MNGFRIFIQEDEVTSRVPCYSGMLADDPAVSCPNCGRVLFQFFAMGSCDYLRENIPVLPELRLFHCPHCSLHLDDYHSRMIGREWTVTGGYSDGGDVTNHNIDLPYIASSVKLEELADDHDGEAYRNRKAEDGVYHQLGGRPIWGTGFTSLCPHGHGAGQFLGMMDYDDLTVPLFENGGNSVALIIGDRGCINLYVCMKCGNIHYHRSL